MKRVLWRNGAATFAVRLAIAAGEQCILSEDRDRNAGEIAGIDSSTADPINLLPAFICGRPIECGKRKRENQAGNAAHRTRFT